MYSSRQKIRSIVSKNANTKQILEKCNRNIFNRQIRMKWSCQKTGSIIRTYHRVRTFHFIYPSFAVLESRTIFNAPHARWRGGKKGQFQSFKSADRANVPFYQPTGLNGASFTWTRQLLFLPSSSPSLEFATLIPSAISPFLNRHLAPAFSLSQLVELNFYPEYARDVRQTFSRGCTERCSLANLSTSENAPGREICKPFMMEQSFSKRHVSGDRYNL